MTVWGILDFFPSRVCYWSTLVYDRVAFIIAEFLLYSAMDLGLCWGGPCIVQLGFGFSKYDCVEISILVGNNFRTWIKFPKLFKGLKTFLFSRRTLLGVASLV